jgi:sugar/nucleoside kinase (ribokinase family)
MKDIDYLAIGHVTYDSLTWDVEGKEEVRAATQLGGTVAYGALTAARLGYDAAMITSFAPKLIGESGDIHAIMHIKRVVIPSDKTTRFWNKYHLDGTRTQYWTDSASTIPVGDEASDDLIRAARIIHLGPIGQEIPLEMLAHIRSLNKNAVIGITPQGWLRYCDGGDLVMYKRNRKLLDALSDVKPDILVMSLADVEGDKVFMNSLLNAAWCGVETLGPAGCEFRNSYDTVTTLVPTIRQHEIDATGAGDIFAAAFMLEYCKTEGLIPAARFANSCGAYSVRFSGLHGVPTDEKLYAFTHQGEWSGSNS